MALNTLMFLALGMVIGVPVAGMWLEGHFRRKRDFFRAYVARCSYLGAMLLNAILLAAMSSPGAWKETLLFMGVLAIMAGPAGLILVVCEYQEEKKILDWDPAAFFSKGEWALHSHRSSKTAAAKWFMLAADLGHARGKARLEKLAMQLTAAEFDEARRMAREWAEANPPPKADPPGKPS